MASPSASRIRNCCLVVETGGRQRRVAISAPETVIGRSEQCDVIVPDHRVSRIHARIVEESGGHYVIDGDSRHGTFVNGVRCQRTKLQHKDKLTLGVPGLSITYLEEVPSESARSVLLSKISERSDHSELQQLRLFLEAASTLGTGGVVEDVLRRMLACAIKVTHAERAFVYLRDKHQRPVMTCGVDAAGTELRDDTGVSESVVEEAMRTAAEFITGDALQQSALAARQSIIANDLRVIIAIPLRGVRTDRQVFSSTVQGVLYLDSHIASRDLTQVSHEVLHALAGECAAVVESVRSVEAEKAAQQYRQELAIAASIQRSLISSQEADCKFARANGHNISCKEVGGDFFDVHQSENALTAIVADVSGKGVSAALLASLIHGMLHAQLDAGTDLVAAISVINKFLCSRVAGQKYATLIVAQVHPDRPLRLVNCGHVPAIIAADGGFSCIEDGDMPVGLMENAQFHLIERPFPPGSRLCLVSDGITESESPQGEEFGMERVQQCLGAPAPIDEVLSRLETFCAGMEPQDDRTMLIVDRTGPDPS